MNDRDTRRFVWTGLLRAHGSTGEWRQNCTPSQAGETRHAPRANPMTRAVIARANASLSRVSSDENHRGIGVA
jgi:hypothetical protein